jgi:hypothetical protein
MARIWPVPEGRQHALPAPWISVSLSRAIALCEVRQGDLAADMATMRGFAEADLDLWYASFKHVAVEVEEDEARNAGWKPGFYKSPLLPKEVFRRLIEEPLVAALGGKNVLRVEVEPSLDALGQGAMLTTIVIAPDALTRLDGSTLIKADMLLQDRLREMHVAGAAITTYATEEELAEVVGS